MWRSSEEPKFRALIHAVLHLQDLNTPVLLGLTDYWFRAPELADFRTIYSDSLVKHSCSSVWAHPQETLRFLSSTSFVECHVFLHFAINVHPHVHACKPQWSPPAGTVVATWRLTSALRSVSSTCRASSTRHRGRCSTRGRTSPSSRPCSSSPLTASAWGRPSTAKPSTTTLQSSSI